MAYARPTQWLAMVVLAQVTTCHFGGYGDFACEALLVFRFEITEFGPQPIRISFELIPF